VYATVKEVMSGGTCEGVCGAGNVLSGDVYPILTLEVWGDYSCTLKNTGNSVTIKGAFDGASGWRGDTCSCKGGGQGQGSSASSSA
jgi:hypothetical protein